MPADVQSARWFFDENAMGVAKALQHVRGDITWPGGPGELVAKGAKDHEWLPLVGKAGLVVLSRDKRIQRNPVERQALLDNGVRAFFQTAGGELNLFGQLQLWMRWWDEMEATLEDEPGPWIARVIKSGVRIFDRPKYDVSVSDSSPSG
ncbi:hypothetical protein WHI96_19215 [Pseudonocardia tropica]|uniref:VapC45 PIN like domain-containing protein n=1 Tax=Pseudonocardia tropica TaxID=681289 RepID=A0ABV1K1D5_9PSEU